MAINGTTGNDTLFGTTGNDLVYASDGNDQVVGDIGNDTLYGGSGNDTIWGQDGQDSIFGDAGADTLYGGTGDDTLYGGTGNDQLQGKEDNDRLYGEDGADSIWGDTGNDYLFGGADNDYLQGGAGNDTLEGGAGKDTIWGDDGLDVLSFEHSPSSVTVSLFAESVSGADGEDYFQSIEGAIGSGYHDLLIGDTYGNLLIGGAGNDRLDGEAGADTLSGGDDNDVLMGEYVTPEIETFFLETVQSAGKDGVTAQIIVPTDPDDPDFLVPVGTYDGVVMVYCSDGWMGSGALLWDGRHILTAAHVVTYSNGVAVDASKLSFEFRLLEGGTVTIKGTAVYVPSDYSPYREDNDIAIIELAETAPQYADRYDIYRGDDEPGQTVTFVGYGATGTGDTGRDPYYPTGVARYGDNTYDILSGDWIGFDPWGTDDGCFLYDFDDGTVAHDILGNNSGERNLGVGDREVSHAGGDSGGPGFIDGKIAGVHSWGSETTSYGAYGGDTRVSVYADWIDSIVGSAVPEGGADLLQGGNGNDWLYGGPGRDSLYGEAGDDSLLFDADDSVVDGGSGNDTLWIVDPGTILFSGVSPNLRNIEVIDLGYTSSRFLVGVTVAAVTAVTDDRNELVILGEHNDGIAFVDTGEWVPDAGLMTLSGYDGEFRSYSASVGEVRVYVQDAVYSVTGEFSLIEGTSEEDSLNGTGNDDLIVAYEGNDTIVGAGGDDTMLFSGEYNDYTIICNPSTGAITVTDTDAGRDGTDTITGVEHFQFADLLESVPTIVSFTPADGADDVAIDADIVITFSEAIAVGSGFVELHDAYGLVERYNVSAGSNLTLAGATLTIDPSADLDYATTYHLIIDSGAIIDLAGLTFDASDESYEFTTRSLELSGTVSFWNGGDPLAGVGMTMYSQPEGLQEGQALSDDDGSYSFDVESGESYRLDARKAADSFSRKAVTFTDALVALKIATGRSLDEDSSEVLSAQYLAADMDHDGTVKTDDALSIVKSASGLSDSHETEWLILPESIAAAPVSNTAVIWPDDPQILITQDSEINFIGIVQGDVNGSWMPV